MSTRIRLYFTSFPDLELLEKGISVYVTRLLGKVEFWERERWGEAETAIIDTGAPVSLIPLDIWRRSEINILGSTNISGVVPKKECSIEVKVGEISLRLIDEENVSSKIRIKAYFSPTNQIPLILGFEGLLRENDVFFSCGKEEAFIEER
jgi:hypothetical protein